MIIDVLVCHPDGTQTVEKREVSDNWLDSEPVLPVTDPLTETQLAVAELAQVVEDNNTANQLAIAELAGIILGG